MFVTLPRRLARKVLDALRESSQPKWAVWPEANRTMGVRAQDLSDGSNEATLSVSETIRRYHDSLIRFLRQRLRVPEDAADVAQEAYIRMMQYESSSQIKSPSSLLFRIAINVANDVGRAEQSRRAKDQCSLDDVEITSDHPSAERELTAEQELSTLYEAIARLPPKCRQVFLLSRVKYMTYPQIAQYCGISVKMVEKHISHALAICAREVDR
jgi:RNA polymerase sigma factor (sigma-70 family)